MIDKVDKEKKVSKILLSSIKNRYLVDIISSYNIIYPKYPFLKEIHSYRYYKYRKFLIQEARELGHEIKDIFKGLFYVFSFCVIYSTILYPLLHPMTNFNIQF
jgi:hypothetical protein